MITPERIVKDTEVERFFTGFDVPVWNPSLRASTKDEAIEQIMDQVVTDYKNSELYRQFRNSQHTIYGEISRRTVMPKQQDSFSLYDDSLLHLDFVPPDNPCRGYFFSDKFPTVYDLGPYKYKGSLVSDYNELNAQEIDTLHPNTTSKQEYPSGNLYTTPDARTLLHRADIETMGERTFGRLFVGPKLH